MYCTRCGCQTGETAKFCSQCGHLAPGVSAASVAMPDVIVEPPPMLTRSLRNRRIAGVCGGIARHFGVDPTLVRVLFVVMFFCPVLPAIIPYLVCWVVMPLERPAPLPTSSYELPPNPQMNYVSR